MAKISSSGIYADIIALLPWTRRAINLVGSDSINRGIAAKMLNANLEMIGAFSESYYMRQVSLTANVEGKEYNLELNGVNVMKAQEVVAHFETYKAIFDFIFKELLKYTINTEKDKVYGNIFRLLGKIERGLLRWRGNLNRTLTFSTKLKK